MKEHFTKPGFVEGLPEEIQKMLPAAKFFHVGDRLCLLIAQNGIVYWDVEKGENVPLKSGNNVSPAWMQSEIDNIFLKEINAVRASFAEFSKYVKVVGCAKKD